MKGKILRSMAVFAAIVLSLSACTRQIAAEESSSSEGDSSESLPSIPVITEEETSKSSEQSSSEEAPESSSEESPSAPPMEPDDEEPFPNTGEESSAAPAEAPNSQVQTTPENETENIDDESGENPNVGDGTSYIEEDLKITPTIKDNPISTTVSIKVVDTAGNPIPNVSVSIFEQSCTSSPNGDIYFFDNLCWQGYPTNHSGETLFGYDARWVPSVIFELTPFQENCKGIDFAHRKRERFQLDLTRAEVQPQVTVTMTGEYSWPEEPTMEITLLHQDGTPCVDYWCILGRPSSGGTSTSQGTGKLNGNGYTDENGKLIFYGTKAGKWSLMTERSEHFRSDGYYNHLQRFEFEVKSIENENHFVFVVND